MVTTAAFRRCLCRANWSRSKRVCHLCRQYTGRIGVSRPLNRLCRGDDFMRWAIRDIGVFLYGCVFAGKYIFFGRSACQPGKQDPQQTSASLFWSRREGDLRHI